MDLTFIELQTILYNGFKKAVPDQNAPLEICHKIMIYYYGIEHKIKMKNYGVHEELIKYMLFPLSLPKSGYYDICKEEPIKACDYYYKCNCCKRHQYNKSYIFKDNLIIITKPTVFVPDFQYSSNICCSHDTTLANVPNINTACRCACRNRTRRCARIFLKKTYGADHAHTHHNLGSYY